MDGDVRLSGRDEPVEDEDDDTGALIPLQWQRRQLLCDACRQVVLLDEIRSLRPELHGPGLCYL